MVLLAVPGLAEGPAEEALAAFRDGDVHRAAELFRTAGELAQSEAEAGRLFNNACVAFHRVGRFEAAHEACVRALRLREGGDPGVPLARTLNNLGLAELELGRASAAEGLFLRALDLNRSLDDLEGQVVNSGNLASTHQRSGRLREADAWLGLASELLHAAPEADWVEQRRANTVINRSVVLERLGEHRRALGLLRELQRTDLDRRTRAIVASNLGVQYRNLGDPVTARHWLERALELSRATDDIAGEINALLNLGRLEVENLGDGEAALEPLSHALTIARESGDRYQEADLLVHLGRAHDLRGAGGRAEEVLGEAIALSRELDFLDGYAEAVEALGRRRLRTGDVAGAVNLLLDGAAEVARAQGALDATAVTAESFALEHRSVYATAVEALFRAGDSESVGAALLLAALSKGEVPDAAGRDLRSGAAGRLGELQASLPADAIALEYLTANGVLYRLAVDRRQGRLQRVGPVEPLRSDLASTRQHFLARSEPEPEVLRRLARALLPPLDPSVAELVVAGDDVLRLFPFETLPLPGGSAPLVRSLTVRYRTTLLRGPRAARADGRSATSNPPPVIALGVTGPPQSPAPLQLEIDAPAPPRSLPALEQVDRELAGIRRAFDRAEVVPPGEATAERMRRALVSGAPVVHVAAHAVLDDVSGPSSFILLDPERAGDAATRLRPADIRELDRAAALVVLSACSTASTDARRGWGLESLVGAFFTAGTEAVIASLWDVDDEATAVFMEQFYARLAQGHGAGRALQETKRAFLDSVDWRGSADWAAFVLIGDDPRIDVGSDPWSHPAVFAVLAAALAAAVFAVRRRRRIERVSRRP